MIIDKFLIINNRGNITIREREPRLDGNEISLRLKLEVPDALFSRPHLEARLLVPISAIPQSTVTPEITHNIEKIVKQVTGLNMVVALIDQQEADE